ncbi:bifunctional phosphoribosylaminoimidazolecarboxamide formyltransferase/IMP cyclohydrolase [Salinisphaera sp.]|uniref:bifunctional phosphoribosylaminoimidazolecarboxamide formyltransferase/IMP cyclohydrolase n=1 Tax=Salinisphaera sp. TaxID=1914330 RepID=UPI002D765B0F|nr:bifunctional phosphoribosylaminoimidazolecarboxamide formyltransferase/IMP cyclohydrolase [Salinisphaera sp.]
MTSTASVTPIRRALISVSDKTGVADFARALAEDHGVEILSTGGTARMLREADVAVIDVAAHTGAPEIMGGRVKTLHPKIHGGILGRRGIDDAVMTEQEIAPIDLVVVNLYPFEQTIARPDTDRETAIETIDIGGPAMLRAAAKNHADVTLVVDGADYAGVLTDLAEHGGTREATRRRLAAKGFAHTAGYDRAIAAYLADDDPAGDPADDEGRPEALPARYAPVYTKRADLRYGENPHQRAALYADGRRVEASLVEARVAQGKPLSYNNLADADAALACVKAFDQSPACVIVKHANPCGVAVAPDPAAAYRRAFATDPVSSFGGIIAFNTELGAETAEAITSNQFAEVILAPAITEDALAVFSKKKNLRVLITGAWRKADRGGLVLKPIAGGLLVQDDDDQLLDRSQLKAVTAVEPTGEQLQDLLFAWRAAKYVKSNAIVYARDGATVGIGAGQMSRVDSARIARQKAADAKLEIAGSVMASDAFFPFRDGIDTAAEAGVAAVIQPGGSIRDEEVIAAADEAGIAMLFTGMRHFRH